MQTREWGCSMQHLNTLLKYQTWRPFILLLLGVNWTLEERRRKHSLSFAKKCLRNEKVTNLLPVNIKNTKNTRNHEKYKVNFAKTERYKTSTIPSLQRMLNEQEKELKDLCTSELCYTPVFPITEKL